MLLLTTCKTLIGERGKRVASSTTKREADTISRFPVTYQADCTCLFGKENFAVRYRTEANTLAELISGPERTFLEVFVAEKLAD